MNDDRSVIDPNDPPKGSPPKRIQLRRTKGWRKPENTATVARPTKWGNPFEIGINGTADECVDKHRHFMEHTHTGRALGLRAQKELRGKNLACWCKHGARCHGDTLIEIANAPS